VRKHTYAALNPLLPGAAVASGGGGELARLLHHAARPARAARRLPSGHAGANAGASSTQLGAVGATVTSKAAVVATVAIIGTSAAGAATVAVVRHIAHHATPRVLTHARPVHPAAPSTVATPPATKLLAPARTAPHRDGVVNHARRVVKHTKPVARTKRKRHHASKHVTKDVVTAAPPATQTATTSATTTQAPLVTQTTQAPPVTHTPTPSSPSSNGSVTNPSYSTPNAP
jgi:hypothetical protein